MLETLPTKAINQIRARLSNSTDARLITKLQNIQRADLGRTSKGGHYIQFTSPAEQKGSTDMLSKAAKLNHWRSVFAILALLLGIRMSADSGPSNLLANTLSFANLPKSLSTITADRDKTREVST